MLDDSSVPGAQAISVEIERQQKESIEELIAEGEKNGAAPLCGDWNVDAVTNVFIGKTCVLLKWLARSLARIEMLESRLAEVEKGGISFGGVYQRALSYKKGTIVNYKGSAWIAVVDVAQAVEPGASARWVLAVKAGRDASARDRRGEG